MKTACINVAWLIAILGWNQFTPASACSFVKINGKFKATVSNRLKSGGIEEDCLRKCYEDTECKFVQFQPNGVDNSQVDCYHFKEGTTDYWHSAVQDGSLTYELRRDESLLNCERKVTINLSGNAPGSTTPTHDNHGTQEVSVASTQGKDS
ncbi:hypothetical protein Y032_0019g3736 [Ancylostoma ceylanicum]|uniref:Apple domain-containing protein n=1 Tax=Ancylostoma ceylanicum TaxID=53326 RepID=A0A016V216_9BILA|nr:hypothetical protein Y032_0019g3736 [Ancylostoma ceylanicum]